METAQLPRKYGYESPGLRNIDSWVIRRGLAASVERACRLWQREAQQRGRDNQPFQLLDVGCGSQPYRAWIESAGVEYAGVDWGNSIHAVNDPAMTRCDLSSPPWPIETAQFDALLCTEVLEHLPDPAGFLRECARVCRPGASILLTAPFVWPEHEQPHDYFRYTSSGLTKLLEHAGFSVEKMWSRGGWHGAAAQLLGLWSYYAVPKPWNYATRIMVWPAMVVLAWLDRRVKHESGLPLTLGYSVIARRRPG